MSHFNNTSTISEEPTIVTRNNNNGSSELKLYQAFIFSVPIFFTFVLLLLFYVFYLRRRRVDWSALRMRTNATSLQHHSDQISTCELGLKKELREMLPVVIFKETFFVKDTLCSVCLGDFQAEEKLQQIPGCGHTFHMECIDLWLSTHSTCPLCRHSLITISTKLPSSSNELVVIVPTHVGTRNDDTSSVSQIDGDETFIQNDSQTNGREAQTSLHDSSPSDSRIMDDTVAAPCTGERDPQDVQVNQHEKDMGNVIKSES